MSKKPVLTTKMDKNPIDLIYRNIFLFTTNCVRIFGVLTIRPTGPLPFHPPTDRGVPEGIVQFLRKCSEVSQLYFCSIIGRMGFFPLFLITDLNTVDYDTST